MTQRVLKWTVLVDDEVHNVGAGQVIYVACQNGPESVQVWTVESALTAQASRPVRVYGTGQEVPFDAVPIGTALATYGHLVWHVFDMSAVAP